jgi:hypothetical protein
MSITDKFLKEIYREVFGLNFIDILENNIAINLDTFIDGNLIVKNNNVDKSTSINQANNITINNNILVNFGIIDIANVSNVINNAVVKSNTINAGFITAQTITIDNNITLTNHINFEGILNTSKDNLFNSSINVDKMVCNSINVNEVIGTNFISIVSPIINIGSDDSIIKIVGTNISALISDITINQDNLLLLNIDQINEGPSDNGSLSGIVIKAADNKEGYIRLSNDLKEFEFKAPNNENKYFVLTSNLANDGIYISGKSYFEKDIESLSAYIFDVANINSDVIVHNDCIFNTSTLEGDCSFLTKLETNNINLISDTIIIGNEFNGNNELKLSNIENIDFTNSISINSYSMNLKNNSSVNPIISYNSTVVNTDNWIAEKNVTINNTLSIYGEAIVENNLITDKYIESENDINCSGNADCNITNSINCTVEKDLVGANEANILASNNSIFGEDNKNSRLQISNNIDILSNNVIGYLNEYTSNEDALSNGLLPGELYRIGGIINICIQNNSI